MKYTKRFFELKNHYDGIEGKSTCELENMEIRHQPFISDFNLMLPDEYESKIIEDHSSIVQTDTSIKENRVFSCPVVLPRENITFKKAIILLHGLNERSWHKYLPWANYLAEKLSCPVVLFPISFHMNRSPGEWGNPRIMINLLKQRKKHSKLKMASFANVALSLRLSQDPLRFFTSGRQSAEDIISFIKKIRKNQIDFISNDAEINFFGYSIGAFLSQVLFIANPDKHLSNSKLFLFGGGSLFSQMQGTSKLIMDNVAFRSLRKYYLGTFLNKVETGSPFSNYLSNNPLGKAFKAMIEPESLKSFREEMLIRLSGQIKVIALKKDKVIPAKAIESTFRCINKRVKNVVEILDFPHEYTHESPFPINNNVNNSLVDQSFNRVFSSAADFLK